MESNKANFTRAEKKLLQYLVPLLEPNTYTKTSSSTLRKSQVSRLQITKSCQKWTQLTALILFLNHLPLYLPSHGFAQNKAESWCFVPETGFMTHTWSWLMHLENTKTKHVRRFFLRGERRVFQRKQESYMRKWHSKEDRKALEQIYMSFPKMCSSLDPLVYLEMLGRAAAQ